VGDLGIRGRRRRAFLRTDFSYISMLRTSELGQIDSNYYGLRQSRTV
jgi:hypothetical protein